MTFLRGGLVGLVACGVLVVPACSGDSESSDDDDASQGAYHPPERHVQGCTHLCEREAEAMCPNETTFEKCVEDCKVGIQFEACAGAWDPVLDCVIATDTVSCSAGGTATMPECVPPYLEFLDCVSTDGLTGELDTECSAYCDAAAGAACPNGESAADCVDGCRVIAGAFPVCADRFAPYLTCGASAEQTCNTEGEPAANGCAGLFGTFLDCLDAEYDWQP